MNTGYLKNYSLHHRINTQLIRLPPTQIYEQDVTPITGQISANSGAQFIIGNANLIRPERLNNHAIAQGIYFYNN